MKKILFTAKNLNIGGMERALVNLLNALAKDYKVTLILEENKGILKEDLNPHIIIKEYKVAQDKWVLIRKIKNFSHRLIWTIQNKNKYDFSCAYATYSLIGAKLALQASKNNALYVHSNYAGVYNHKEKEIKAFFASLSYEKFKNLIFVSKEALEDVQDILNISNGLVINNLTDYLLIKKEAKEKISLPYSSDKINLLYVGRLDNTSKNFDLLLESFAKTNLNKNVLYILGNGSYKEEINKKIKELKLTKNVILIKEVKNPYPYIKNCDSLILTSRYEGFPLIYNEALVLNQKFITTIRVNDGLINIDDYFEVVKPNPSSISKKINEVTKDNLNYNIDFANLNKKNYQKIVNIIEGENNGN